MSKTSYSIACSHEQAEQLKKLLQNKQFEFVAKPYTHFSAKGQGVNVSVYLKGPKVLVQGKDTEDFVRFTLEPEVLGKATLDYLESSQPELFSAHFGVDESGKGDFLGALVVGGVYVDETTARTLIDFGVTDSKKISSHQKIFQLAERIRRVKNISFDVITLRPAKYNELYASFKNLNLLLAWAHAAVIKNLQVKVPSCPRALSDQFAHPKVLQTSLNKMGVKIELQQRTKAESDVAVAAASIIARERFLKEMKSTSQQWGIEFPLGASHLVKTAAEDFVNQHGKEQLPQIAKMHFKTAQELFS